MEMNLSPETQKLIEDRMKQYGYTSPDETVRIALEMMDQPAVGEPDEETLAAIEEGEAQLERGEGRPLQEVEAEFRAKFFRK